MSQQREHETADPLLYVSYLAHRGERTGHASPVAVCFLHESLFPAKREESFKGIDSNALSSRTTCEKQAQAKNMKEVTRLDTNKSYSICSSWTTANPMFIFRPCLLPPGMILATLFPPPFLPSLGRRCLTSPHRCWGGDRWLVSHRW